MIGLGEAICPVLGVAVLLGGMAFWIWMIVDCAKNEPATGNDKIVWILIILLAQVFGAAIYYFVRHRPRIIAQWRPQ